MRATTSPPAPARQARAVATRARLLDATIASLVRVGYAGTSTNEVCRRARVARGTQLHHFPSKHALVAAAIEHLFARRLEEFREHVGAIAPGRSRIDAAIAVMLEIYTGPTLAAWLELVVAARTDAQLRSCVAEVEQRFFALATASFRELLGPGLTPGRARATTRIVLAAFDGLALHHMVQRDRHALDAAAAILRTLLHEEATT